MDSVVYSRLYWRVSMDSVVFSRLYSWVSVDSVVLSSCTGGCLWTV